jgi:hypothetical protein
MGIPPSNVEYHRDRQTGICLYNLEVVIGDGLDMLDEPFRPAATDYSRQVVFAHILKLKVVKDELFVFSQIG